MQAADAAKAFAANPNDRELAKDALKQNVELYRFFHLNKIYLPSVLCGSLGNYESKLRELVTVLNIYWSEEFPTQQMAQERIKVMLEAWKALETELPGAMVGLEKEFRQLLGVELQTQVQASAQV